jgi:hypothetical protein
MAGNLAADRTPYRGVDCVPAADLPASLPPKRPGPVSSRFPGHFSQIALGHTRGRMCSRRREGAGQGPCPSASGTVSQMAGGITALPGNQPARHFSRRPKKLAFPRTQVRHPPPILRRRRLSTGQRTPPTPSRSGRCGHLALSARRAPAWWMGSMPNPARLGPPPPPRTFANGLKGRDISWHSLTSVGTGHPAYGPKGQRAKPREWWHGLASSRVLSHRLSRAKGPKCQRATSLLCQGVPHSANPLDLAQSPSHMLTAGNGPDIEYLGRKSLARTHPLLE